MSFSPLELEKLLSGRFSALASENVMSFGDAVKGRYEDLLPLYQEILGADQESKDATKAQMLFDVAQGGLQLAAGVPGAGSSFASQLAGAAAPVAGRIQERGAALEQERRGIKQGALGTAMQQAMSEEEFNQAFRLARMQAGRQTYDFDTYVRSRTDDPKTDEVESGLETRTVDPRDTVDIADARRAGFIPESVYRAEMGGDKAPKPMIIENRNTGEVVANIDLSTAEGLARRSAMTNDEIMVSPRSQTAVERAVVILDDSREFASVTGGLSYVDDGVTLPTPTDAQVLKGNDLAAHLQKKSRAEKYSTVYEATLADINENPNTVGLDPLTIIVNSSKKVWT